MLQQFRGSVNKWIWWFIVLCFIVVFVFAETSGLTGRSQVTRGTAVATVNGTSITYDDWLRAKEDRTKQAQQQSPTPLTLDEMQRIDDATFDDMVNDILLQQEYKRRGITISDQEIQQAALEQPPPQFLQSPEFQTEGRFDIDKYRRFLSSPMVKEQGVLNQLEQYYRGELPREKLFGEVAASVYVTDAQLWRAWQDTHDSVQISYVRLAPDSIPDSAVHVTDQEIAQYFQTHQGDFPTRLGRAAVSVAVVPRTITAADTAKVRQHAIDLRNQIVSGKSTFEDVAKRESADSASAAQGGSLGKVTRGQFVPQFDSVAFSLKPGEISQPVLTQFGFHLIKVDERKGDTISVRHILLRIQQSDSSAAISDRFADSLSKAATTTDRPGLFDSLTTRLGIHVFRATATEGQPLIANGEEVPSVSAWAFTAKPGETSDLIDSPDAYYLARLDTLQAGGKPTLASERDDIRNTLIREKKIDLLVPKAQRLSDAVAGGKTLEQAATAAHLHVVTTPMFTRTSSVPELGQATKAIGAAFGLHAGAVSAPVKTSTAVFVMRADRRVSADSAAWQKQKSDQRARLLQNFRQQRVQAFMAGLRETAKIKDNRKAIEEASRQAAS